MTAARGLARRSPLQKRTDTETRWPKPRPDTHTFAWIFGEATAHRTARALDAEMFNTLMLRSTGWRKIQHNIAIERGPRMSNLNLPASEREALKAIDDERLEEHIERALQEVSVRGLRSLGLEQCGGYVYRHLREFSDALTSYANAKSLKKVRETQVDARRAGNSLAHAVHGMKERVEREEAEEQRFSLHCSDLPPSHFSETMRTCIAYQWRATLSDAWQHGHITFTHDAIVRPDYSEPRPARAPGARQRDTNRQEALAQIWEHLRESALYAIRDFFRDGGAPADVPTTFRAIADLHTGQLNNFSLRFWSQRAQSAKP